jgi:hypothetical protein
VARPEPKIVDLTILRILLIIFLCFVTSPIFISNSWGFVRSAAWSDTNFLQIFYKNNWQNTSSHKGEFLGLIENIKANFKTESYPIVYFHLPGVPSYTDEHLSSSLRFSEMLTYVRPNVQDTNSIQLTYSIKRFTDLVCITNLIRALLMYLV